VVVDTSVLVAGISGFKETYIQGKNPSADVLNNWAEEHNFIWLVSEDILDEYKEVLKRLRVRSSLIGRVINLIRERAEEVKVRYSVEISPDPGDDPFCLCADQGKADFILTLNPRDFPQDRLKATVVSPDRFHSEAIRHRRSGIIPLIAKPLSHTVYC
jgi:predicted nucleic acid-binding protein